MTWAALEEDQGNAIRAEEIRNLYFQQVRTSVTSPIFSYTTSTQSVLLTSSNHFKLATEFLSS